MRGILSTKRTRIIDTAAVEVYVPIVGASARPHKISFLSVAAVGCRYCRVRAIAKHRGRVMACCENDGADRALYRTGGCDNIETLWLSLRREGDIRRAAGVWW